MEKLSTLVSKGLAFLVSNLGIYTVNSTCMLGLGQEEEPVSLSKYKVER